MNLLLIVLPVAVVLTIAYFTYGRVLSRLLQLDPERPTPAIQLRDDQDYSPIEPKFLFPQHFSAIAAAGPIVGPILAGVMFGWLPALVWILVGSIFIGGVHDMTALVASIRHKARSIAEVVRDHMTERSYFLFLAFVWLALVYIIVAFTDITATSFIGLKDLATGKDVPPAEAAAALQAGTAISGGGIATSSLLYLVLPIVMGVLLRYTKLSLNLATLIFVPLVGVAIWVGQFIPFDIAHWFDLTDAEARKAWDVAILGYCLVAAVVPVWALLQPRGHLGGYFLYAALGAAALGLVVGGKSIEYPAFTGWTSASGASLAPMLFITIACGACSGFHSMIASGTTSKQLRRETDARPIGYGAMLLEAMVATVSLCCVMVLVPGSPTLKSEPNFIYALGIGGLLEPTGISAKLAVSFALMAFTTFVYDTLDVCTRLGRYIIQELLGAHNAKGKWIGTILTAGVPLFFVMQTAHDASGNVIPVWRMFWALFGASNQLLAALTLLGVTVWLWRTRRATWVWFVTGIPTAVMYTMSTWALVDMIGAKVRKPDSAWYLDVVTWVAIVLVALAALMLVEAARVLWSLRNTPPPAPRGVAAPA